VVFLNGERKIMKKHLLIDLDGTLLENDMDVFAPAYYHLLSSHLAPRIAPDKMIQYLLAGTKAMILNLDGAKTLEQVFDEVFYPGIGIEKSEIIADIQAFYAQKFHQLKSVTRPIPEAVRLVTTALDQGYQVSIATNPLFPRTAILQRLSWTGLDLEEQAFTLIPSYETFHHAKPNPEYYLELLTQLQTSPEDCVMVGNDYEADIIPSTRVGIFAFHIVGSNSTRSPHTSSGSLSEVLPWLSTL